MRRFLLLNCFLVLDLILVFAQNSDTLLTKARILIDQERCDEAASIYEKILETEVRNYESYAFLGSYYYLMGKDAVDSVEKEYKAIILPNHMQTAQYQDKLKNIYFNDYEKANTYLLKAFEIEKNDHLAKLMGTIHSFKVRIGLAPVKKRRKSRV